MKLMRFIRSLWTLILFSGFALTSCASPSPVFNALADGIQQSDANRIVERAFTESMPILAENSVKGGYKDRLSYQFALDLGRSPTDPFTDLAKVVPLEERRYNVPDGGGAFLLNATPERRGLVDEWVQGFVGSIRACENICPPHSLDPSEYLFTHRPVSYTTNQEYVEVIATSCLASITSTYKRQVTIDHLIETNDMRNARRKPLADYVLHEFKFTDVFWRHNGGKSVTCELKNYYKYMSLYEKYNPSLSSSLGYYIDLQLNDDNNTIF